MKKKVTAREYNRIILKNTYRNSVRNVKKLVSWVNWLYVFGSLLTYYSLKLFYNNVFVCYIILVLFILTTVVFLYTNFQKLNQKEKPRINGSFKPYEPRVKLHKFAFVDSANWQSELQLLTQRNHKELERLIYPDSVLISSLLDQLVGVIIDRFVKPWYNSINNANGANFDDLFVDQIKISIKAALVSIYSRVATIDLPGLLVVRILPLITDHFNKFIAAKKAVLAKNSNLNTNDPEFNLLLCKYYNYGKLHHVVNSFRENSQFSAYSQKQYLRDKIGKIIPMVMAKSESSSSPVALLVREIVVNCVFVPAISKIVAPDFWNSMIVQQVGQTLKDRNKVLQLREELQKHSKSFKQQQKSRSKSKKSEKEKMDEKAEEPAPSKNTDKTSLHNFSLTLTTSQSTFEKMLKKINKNGSVSELRHLKFYVNLQLQKTLRSSDLQELEQNQDATNKKASDTLDRYRILIKRLQIVQLTLANRINSLNLETGSKRSVPIAVGSESTEFSLQTILNDPNLLTYFMEYMDQQNRTLLLQFWLVVNGIKSPLEDVTTEDLYEDPGSSDELQHAQDIVAIFHTYFNNKLVINNNRMVYENVEKFIQCYDKYQQFGAAQDGLEAENEYEAYTRKQEVGRSFNKAKKSLILLQSQVFETMQKDLEKFQQSPLFLKLLASKQESEKSGKLQSDPLSQYESDDDNVITSTKADVQSSRSNATSQSTVVNKGANGLAHGVAGSGGATNSVATANGTGPNNPEGSSLVSYDVLTAVESALGEIVARNDYKLEPQLSEVGSVLGELVDSEQEEVELAAPGDLSLAEEIAKLSSDIENLNGQLEIIGPLIRKAELTNNVAELQVLRKAEASVSREVQLKQLQKAQFVVQDSENKLFGTTEAYIKSYLVDTDSKGNEYTSYLIEVARTNGAGWIVARRFSQFHVLNQHLKETCPKVKLLKFPKKTVFPMNQNQQKLMIETRMVQLEQYLQELLKLEQVCESPVFRLFLSSRDFAYQKSNYQVLEDVTAKLYSGIANGIEFGASVFGKNAEFQNELNSYDSDDKVAFVKPICDFLLAIFSLNKANSWLKGRAVLVVLQQIFGSTIERKVRDYLQLLHSEDKMIDWLNLTKDMLYAQDQPQEQKKPNSAEAREFLEVLFADLSSKIVGVNGARFAAVEIHGMLQNEVLNTHVCYTVLDEVLDAIFAVSASPA